MITSPSNPEVRATAALHKRAEREKTGLFLVEGRAEIERAAAAGIEIVTIYHVGTLPPATVALASSVVELSEKAFEKIAYGRDGVLATAVAPRFDLADLAVGSPAFVLVVDSIEKPGNLGAILRSADGAGASVIVSDPTTDLVNPNVVRASLGSLFTIPVAAADSRTTISYLKKHAIRICTAMVDTGSAPWEIDLKLPIAIVVGSEHTGLSNIWTDAADESVTIPLAKTAGSGADSLNASVAAAVLMFEVVRQRANPL
jgi:TrmH family RNA methyltransferase